MRSRGRHLNSIQLSFIAIGAAVALSACTNNALKRAIQSASDSSTGNPLDKIINPGNESTVALSSVIKNAQSPTSTFDLLGDSSGMLGTSCTATGQGKGNVGESTCMCSYTYQMPDGSTQNFEAQTTYHESNLIRCLYAGIPVAVNAVSVRIHLLSDDTYSNAVTFKFNGAGVSLDTSVATTFTTIQRYQCRDSVWIPNNLDSHVYDPFQSEDPRNTYPLNFYTSNMGGALAIFAGAMASKGIPAPTGWNCPSIPNDPSYGMDLKIYSVAADSNGSKQIYPRGNSAFDRSTFYLAKTQTGVFNVPVDSYVAPTIRSTAPDPQGVSTGVDPIGWGASPIPNGISGQETCPDSSIQIPSGYHWVKVWLFRMALPARTYYQSTPLAQMGTVACNPGQWANQAFLAGQTLTDPYVTQYRSVVADCFSQSNDNSTRVNNATSITDLTAPVTLASRFVDRTSLTTNGDAACWNIDPNINFAGLTGPGATTYTNQGPGKLGLAQYAAATDKWQQNKREVNSSGATITTCVNDPAHICSNGFPSDGAPTSAFLDNATYGRFDYLFVVSPPSVMSGDMSNPSSQIHNTYTPYRFMNQGDCVSQDPDLPSAPGDCDVRYALRNYGLKLHDVNTAGDPPASDPNRPGVFPVCAIQPD